MAEPSNPSRQPNAERPTVIIVADSVEAGSIAAVDSHDVEMVLWRSTTGVLCASDARCPHQWSHLAAVGVVDGDALVCTSHRWRFDADGAGCTTNAHGGTDVVLGLSTYPVSEQENGTIEITLMPNPPPKWP